MKELKKKQCRNIGLKQSLISAIYGLVCAILVFTFLMILVGELRGLLSLLERLLKSILVGVGALLIIAAILGMFAGELICKFKGQHSKVRLVGIVLAESCLLVTALAGSSVEFFANLNDAFAFSSYIGKPTISVVLFGFIPALILGIIYSRRVEKLL